MIVGTQGYSWFQIYQAQGKNYREQIDDVLGQVAACGIEAWEDGIPSKEYADRLAMLLPKHKLKMVSMYDGGEFHTGQWHKSVDATLERAKWGQALGVTVVNVNPNPIGRPKKDEEMATQAEALQTLGEQLHRDGMHLAIHSHDPEMKAGAREFHHNMVGTEPAMVGMCLDCHWVFRGAENSQVAMYDASKLYFDRIRSFHIRQSIDGVWTQALCKGDIDYAPLAKRLQDEKWDGPLVIERAVEAATKQTMDGVEAHKLSRKWIREVFGI